jgi:hypothetical protein
MNSKDQHIGLIRQALWKWSRDLPIAKGLLERADFDLISKTDADFICDILARELTDTGLGPNSEPTSRGLQIEETIDWVRARLTNGVKGIST